MGKAFNTEFRDMIVQLHINKGEPIKKLAEEHGISASSVSRWIAAYRNREFLNAQKLSEDAPFDS